jgi:hypothetical protein
MKAEGGRNWYQSIHFLVPNGHHHVGASTFSAPLEHFGTVLTGWVSNISQRPHVLWISVTALFGDKKSQKFTLMRG